MRKLCLAFSVCAALVFSSTVNAQEDVTAKYIVNPSFELKSESENFSESKVAYGDNDETLYGWVTPNLYSSTRDIQVVSNEGEASTVFGKQIEPSEGSYYFFNRKGWSNVYARLEQKEAVVLPSGRYYITIDCKAAEANYTAKTLGGTKVGFSVTKTSDNSVLKSYQTIVGINGKPNGGKYVDTYLPNTSWKTVGMWFEITEDTEVKIAVTEYLAGSKERADMCLDNMKLYRWSLDDSKNYVNASDETPLNVTDKFIKNPDFDEDASGWTSDMSGLGRGAEKTGDFNGYYLTKWSSSKYTGKISQTLTELPQGKYRFTMACFSSSSAGVSLFLGENETPLTVTSEPRVLSVEGYVDATGTVELGFKAEQGVTWIGIDRARLEYLGKSYSRNVTSGDYGTICLPYEVDLASVSGVEKVYKVSSMTSELAILTPVEAMEAGKPYIFKSNAAEVVMPAKVGGAVVGTPQEDTYLVGTFADIDKMDYGTYVLSGNKFCKVVEGNEGDAVTLRAYRCYFKPLTNGVKNFGFVEDGGETTGINNAENEVDMKNAVIYDLTGRKVTSPVKGIYIVNGKKMVVDNLK